MVFHGLYLIVLRSALRSYGHFKTGAAFQVQAGLTSETKKFKGTLRTSVDMWSPETWNALVLEAPAFTFLVRSGYHAPQHWNGVPEVSLSFIANGPGLRQVR